MQRLMRMAGLCALLLLLCCAVTNAASLRALKSRRGPAVLSSWSPSALLESGASLSSLEYPTYPMVTRNWPPPPSSAALSAHPPATSKHVDLYSVRAQIRTTKTSSAMVPDKAVCSDSSCKVSPAYVLTRTAVAVAAEPVSKDDEEEPTTTDVCYEVETSFPAGAKPDDLVPLGRVVAAEALVVRGGKTNPGPWAREYCDVLFDPWQKLGSWEGKKGGLRAIAIPEYDLPYSRVYEVGHVIAASLGGSNEDPLNFYPQLWSNNRGAGSEWYAQEELARTLKDVYDEDGTDLAYQLSKIKIAAKTRKALVAALDTICARADPLAGVKAANAKAFVLASCEQRWKLANPRPSTPGAVTVRVTFQYGGVDQLPRKSKTSNYFTPSHGTYAVSMPKLQGDWLCKQMATRAKYANIDTFCKEAVCSSAVCTSQKPWQNVRFVATIALPQLPKPEIKTPMLASAFGSTTAAVAAAALSSSSASVFVSPSVSGGPSALAGPIVSSSSQRTHLGKHKPAQDPTQKADERALKVGHSDKQRGKRVRTDRD